MLKIVPVNSKEATIGENKFVRIIEVSFLGGFTEVSKNTNEINFLKTRFVDILKVAILFQDNTLSCIVLFYNI